VLQSDNGATQLDVSAAEPGVSPERLELLAAVRGLEALDQPSQVTLYTASRSLRQGLQYGLAEWRENRWQWEHFGRLTPIKNADLWQRIDRAMHIHDIRCRALGAAVVRDDLGGAAASGDAGCRELRNQPRSVSAGAWERSAIMRAVRGFFGWCGLCRSASALVIAPQ
jgi:ribonuclease HI